MLLATQKWNYNVLGKVPDNVTLSLLDKVISTPTHTPENNDSESCRIF